jgi:peptidoglycan hydrolase CwlO-like protein
MRKVFTFLLSICISLCIIPFQPVLAEDPPYTDTDYWNKLCSNYRDLDEDQISACEAYLKASSSTLNDQLEALKAQEDDIKANIADYGLKIQNYQEEIDAKQTEINATVNSIAAMQKAIDNKQIEIDNKQIEIENKQKEIDATQAEIDAANEKIKTRMEISQSSMRLNKYTDILMGADSFEEFLRISNGLSAIAQYDQKILEDMKELRAKLNAAGRSDCLIQVDGGCCVENTAELVRAGADVLVSGSAFFGFPPFKERLAAFMAAAEQK